MADPGRNPRTLRNPRNPFARVWRWYQYRPPLARRLYALLALAIVVPPLVWGGVRQLNDGDKAVACPGGAAGVWVADGGECVGVTDGSHVFFQDLTEVSKQIRAANQRVEDAGTPYATIALMIPMIPLEDRAAERTQVLREVQGAYLAQHLANQKGANAPPIRLVLANPGRDSAHWKEVADQLVALSRSEEHRLRAVFGFNISVQPVKDTIAYLTKKENGIPVVGGPITAHTLANNAEEPQRYPGLTHIVPNNWDQAEALTNHLGVKPEETFLIVDESLEDLYSQSLEAAFREQTRGTLHEPETYTSNEVIANEFAQIVNNLCDSTATTVYFAGRPDQMMQLLVSMGDRGCVNRHFTVVTVSGASTLALDTDMDWGNLTRGEGISVKYATITHPDAWTSNPPRTGGSDTPVRKLRQLIAEGTAGEIGETGLTDGRTITTHDSALTAIEAIRNQMDDKDVVPELSSVKEAWRRLHGPDKVDGASGWICLDKFGNAYNKAVAIVELSPEGEHIVFEKLAWPKGEPPSVQCKEEAA